MGTTAISVQGSMISCLYLCNSFPTSTRLPQGLLFLERFITLCSLNIRLFHYHSFRINFSFFLNWTIIFLILLSFLLVFCAQVMRKENFTFIVGLLGTRQCVEHIHIYCLITQYLCNVGMITSISHMKQGNKN